jgi:hypothetical protein
VKAEDALLKFFKVSVFALACLMVVIQLVRPSMTNPRVDQNRDIAAVYPTSVEVASTLQRSCNDCHSNRTLWPWYSHVAPASWLVARDVNSGRSVLNFSEWSNYSPEKKDKLMGKICEEVSEREMPAFQYTLLHRHARLTVSEIRRLCAWTRHGTQTGSIAERDE